MKTPPLYSQNYKQLIEVMVHKVNKGMEIFFKIINDSKNIETIVMLPLYQFCKLHKLIF